MHGFSDSSGRAYGVCVFFRVSCEHGNSVRLCINKCRLVPVKELSIPRLESLLSLVDGTCEVGSGEKGFFKKDFLLDGLADCVVVDSTEG